MGGRRLPLAGALGRAECGRYLPNSFESRSTYASQRVRGSAASDSTKPQSPQTVNRSGTRTGYFIIFAFGFLWMPTASLGPP